MKDRALKNMIAAILGMAIGGLICLAIDCHASPVAGDFERVKYANALQMDFQNSGYEIWTAAYGPDKNCLFINSAEFVDGEIVTNFIKDVLVEWEALGFEEVMLTSGEVTMILNVKKASDTAKGKVKM